MALKRYLRKHFSHWWVPPRLPSFSHQVKGRISIRLSYRRQNERVEDIFYSSYLQSDSKHWQVTYNGWKSKKFGNASNVELKDSNHKNGIKDRLGKNNILKKGADWFLYKRRERIGIWISLCCSFRSLYLFLREILRLVPKTLFLLERT